MRISDLPDPLIANISLYLATPARALFAASMTAPSSSWEASGWKLKPNATSKAIVSAHRLVKMKSRFDSEPRKEISQPWDILFLNDLEKSLLNKLTDGDIGAMLACINAKENLRWLRLTYCTNITGSGLAPLWGSTRLSTIDLTLKPIWEDYGREEKKVKWTIDPGTLLCESTVLKFLHGILDNEEDFSLDSCCLPDWSGEESNDFKKLLKRYNKLFNKRWGRGYDDDVSGSSDWEEDDYDSESSENTLPPPPPQAES
ncbi:hypothetical protein ACHAWF_001642 [Thalassiosira exigua]